MKKMCLITTIIVLIVTMFSRCNSKAPVYDLKMLHNIEQNLDRFREDEINKTNEIINDYKVQCGPDTEKYYPYYRKMLLTMRYAEDLDSYLAHLKDTLQATGDVQKLMIGHGIAESLKNSIDQTIQKMLLISEWQQPDSDMVKMIKSPYAYDFNTDPEWESRHFGEGITPAVAQMGLINMRLDLAHIELTIVKKIFEDGHIFDYARSRSYPWSLAISKSPFYAVGDRVEGAILMARLNPMLRVTKMIANGKQLEVTNDVGVYEEIARTEGLKKYLCTATVKDTSGVEYSYETILRYYVIKPTALVSVDNMHYLFAGIPNPITVLAAFTTSDNLVVSISRGKITGSKGKYVVEVDEPGNVMIRVGAKQESGSVVAVDSTAFNVKRQ